MYYLMSRLVAEDSALIESKSHTDTNFFSGSKLAPDFKPPVLFDLDLDVEGRRMPTFFDVPAFVARKSFYELLLSTGIDNIDTYPAVIRDAVSGAPIHGYLVVNIIGLVACVDLSSSETSELGDGLRLINKAVLRKERLPNAHIFRLVEDPLQIVVSEVVANAIREHGLGDVYLEPANVV